MGFQPCNRKVWKASVLVFREIYKCFLYKIDLCERFLQLWLCVLVGAYEDSTAEADVWLLNSNCSCRQDFRFDGCFHEINVLLRCLMLSFDSVYTHIFIIICVKSATATSNFPLGYQLSILSRK